jgi:hypothetical protein
MNTLWLPNADSVPVIIIGRIPIYLWCAIDRIVVSDAFYRFVERTVKKHLKQTSSKLQKPIFHLLHTIQKASNDKIRFDDLLSVLSGLIS